MDKKDILYCDEDNVIVVKPPECRIFTMGVDLYLSLPYIVHMVRFGPYDGVNICVGFSQKPVKSIDDKLYGLPLPNVHCNGFVCGITLRQGLNKKPEQVAEKMIDLFWNSVWRCCRGYHWMDKYGESLQFHNRLKELRGEKVLPRKRNVWGGWDDDPYSATNFDAEMYNNWHSLSKQRPDFIMDMPLIAHEIPYTNASEIIRGVIF